MPPTPITRGSSWRKRGVGEQRSELLAGKALIAELDVDERVVTANALPCQREVCEAILAKGGDSLIKVKANQPRLLADMIRTFDEPPSPVQQYVQHSRHGNRGEVRTIEVRSDLVGYSDWPGVEQVCRVQRVVTTKAKTAQETRYAVTSLKAEGADPVRLLALHRGRWGIENQVQYVRDETMGEDRSQVRSGAAPQVLAALRNTVLLNLLRLAESANIAAALRRHASHPEEALALLEIVL
ncbi:MAG: ISAs1 family transposase [Dehalococcoidia bacterium]